LSSLALLYAVHADLGALSAMVRRGFEKLSQINGHSRITTSQRPGTGREIQ
jgi:hypothetical protein